MTGEDASIDDLGPFEFLRLARDCGLADMRMITFSKSGYIRRHPDHYTLFNAAIVDEAGQPLWRGDLDLTVDEDAIVALAMRSGRRLAVLHERDAWTSGARGADPDLAVVAVEVDGSVALGAQALPRASRAADGRLRAPKRSGVDR